MRTLTKMVAVPVSRIFLFPVLKKIRVKLTQTENIIHVSI